MPIDANEIDLVCDYVEDLCGVYLDKSKSYLIDSRLSRLLQESGCRNYSEFVAACRRSSGRELRDEVVDAITTHETLFFRDQTPFRALQHKALPELIDAKANSASPRRLRIWSGACSTGQEVYSIAITLCELIPDCAQWNIEILGTDISAASVERAREGRYAKHEVARGLPATTLQKYFDLSDGYWQVNEQLKKLVRFETLNLLKPFHFPQKFDMVFCRNVAIYFQPEARRDLFDRVARWMIPEGYLFVGSSENLCDLGPRFEPHHHCGAVFYRPNLAATEPV